jgi:two-component system chemotaxis response regulator CheY
MRILIVDDSKAMRMIVARCIRQAGFTGDEVLEATDGAHALTMLKEHSPNLVISDWNMPNMSGLELLQNAKAANPALRFGFVTSESTDDMRALAKQHGAGFFLTKPIQAPDLKQAIEGLK